MGINTRENKTAIVFMADGMEMCECLLTVDILRRAKINVITASVMDRNDVTASHQVRIFADMLAEDVDYDAADMLILPGGRIGTENLSGNCFVTQKCSEFAADENKYIAAVCAAPSVFAGVGLLKGRKATCHPDFASVTAEGGAVLTGDSVTVDGHIITGQGLGASIDFALCLAEILAGKDAADRIRTAICYRH